MSDLLREAAEALARAYNHADPDCPICQGQARPWADVERGLGHSPGCLISRLLAAADWVTTENKPPTRGMYYVCMPGGHGPYLMFWTGSEWEGMRQQQLPLATYSHWTQLIRPSLPKGAT